MNLLNSVRIQAIWGTLACVSLISSNVAADQQINFVMRPPKGDVVFVIQLTDPDKIAQARAIISGTAHQNIVWGNIVKGEKPYNARWHFFLDPPSIRFVASGPKHCDLSAFDIEKKLASGEPLPKDWCPRAYRLVRELAVLEEH